MQPDLDVLALGGSGVNRNAFGGDVRAVDQREDVEHVLLEAVGVTGRPTEESRLRDEARGVEGERVRGGKQESVDDALVPTGGRGGPAATLVDPERPMPRSNRPGCSAATTPAASTTCRGE